MSSTTRSTFSRSALVVPEMPSSAEMTSNPCAESEFEEIDDSRIVFDHED